MTASPQALPPVGAKPWPRWLKSWLNAQTGVAWLFILPSVIGFIVFYAVPAVRGVTISLTNWDLLTTPKPVGLQNYVTLLQDKDFWHSMLVTLYYVALNIPMQTGLAILIAVLMDRFTKSFVVRGVLIIPWLIPLVVSGLLFLWILDPTLGILNVFLKFFGISRQPFLGSVTQAMPTVAGINIWRHMGYTALLVFAGLQSIPKDMYEAGAIDGATEWRMFWNLTLPMLRPVLVFVITITLIASANLFGQSYIMTGTQSRVIGTESIVQKIYDEGILQNRMGSAAAMSVFVAAVLLILTTINFRVFGRSEEQ